MLRNTMQMLIAHARQNGELIDKLWVAIDVTKRFLFTSDAEEYEDDTLGYMDGDQYYQWAIIKIVGLDVPLILDAIPRERASRKTRLSRNF